MDWQDPFLKIECDWGSGDEKTRDNSLFCGSFRLTNLSPCSLDEIGLALSVYPWEDFSPDHPIKPKPTPGQTRLIRVPSLQPWQTREEPIRFKWRVDEVREGLKQEPFMLCVSVTPGYRVSHPVGAIAAAVEMDPSGAMMSTPK